MVKGKTESGFEFEVDETIYGDYRLTLAIGATLSDNPKDKIKGTYQLTKLILGDKGTASLMDYIAKQNGGNVPKEAVNKEFGEIVAFTISQKEAKN